MSLIGFKCSFKGDVLFKDCLECAKQLDNPCKEPYEYIKGLVDNNEDRGSMISSSCLVYCPRRTYLQRTVPYFDYMDKLHYAFRGTVCHKVLEDYQHGEGVVEKRFSRVLPNGIEISGKPDVFYPTRGILRDWKSANGVPSGTGVKNEHYIQLNTYRWILAKPKDAEPVEINQMYAHYITMAKFVTRECACMNMDLLEEKISPIAEMLYEAFENGIVPPVKEGYPADWQCQSYCAESIRNECANIFRLGKKQ